MPTDSLIDTQPFYLWDTAYWTPEATEVNVGVPLDSIFPCIDRQAPMQRRSLFAGHTLPAEHDSLQPRQSSAAPAWFFIILLLIGGAIYIYFTTRKIKMRELLLSTIDHRAMDRLVRGRNLTPMRLMSVGVMVSSLAAVAVCYVADLGVGMWLALSVGLSLAYLFRWGLLRLLGRVFDDEDAISTYIIRGYLYHLVLSVALVPLLMLTIYMPWDATPLLMGVGGLTALFFLARLVSGIKNILTHSNAPSFYLFYYLCTVEMIPVLVLLKLYLSQ